MQTFTSPEVPNNPLKKETGVCPQPTGRLLEDMGVYEPPHLTDDAPRMHAGAENDSLGGAVN